jgi:Dolichyl-phosphate-mannose-protein mannosyltransferase
MNARERLCAGAILLALVARVVLVFNQAGDFDEFQMLHGAWNVAQGLLPYRDFWENHGPAPYYLLAPIFWGGGGHDEALFFVGRAVAALCGVGVLAVSYRLARLFVGRTAAWAAVAMLAWTPIFAVKTVEARPDVFLMLLWMGALLLYFGGGRRALWAGVLVGAEMWISPKALFGLTAVVLGALVEGAATRQVWKGLRAGVVIGLGFLLPVAALALLFLLVGALGPLVRWMVVFNFTIPPLLDLSRPDLLLPSMLCLEFLGVVGIGLAVARPGDGRRVALATITLVHLVIHLFIMPTPFVHNALPALPPLCVLAVLVLDGTERKTVWLVALLGTLVLPMVFLVQTGKLWERDARLAAQLEIGAYVRAHVPPDGVYFGPAAYPITRRSAWFFHVVVGEVVEALAQGRYPPPDIPPLVPTLRRAGCPVIISGTSFGRLRTPELSRFIARNYRVALEKNVEIIFYTVWVADGGCRR